MPTETRDPEPGRLDQVWIKTDQPWDELVLLTCERKVKNAFEMKSLPERLDVTVLDKSLLYRSPFTQSVRDEMPEFWRLASHVRDLGLSIMREKGEPVAYRELTARIKTDPRLHAIPEIEIINIIKCCVALGSFVFERWKLKTREPLLRPSASNHERERLRVFTASFGDELSALSNRVASIIQHGPSVGTYREQLLQSLLQKSVPSRYHVATGFILGCNRQIDVLIYDHLEYAPLFREGNMVVIRAESVRAAIEVKTSLTVNRLRDSLELLDAVPGVHCYGSSPPIFKGVFAFRTGMSRQKLSECVAGYYNVSMEDDEYNFTDIDWPYNHLTALCVHESAYLYTSYVPRSGKQQFMPVVRAVRSLTDLRPQSALFLAQLLAHLLETPKQKLGFRVDDILGADIHADCELDLARANWGPYSEPDEFDHEAEGYRAKRATELIGNVRRWLSGEPWRSLNE